MNDIKRAEQWAKQACPGLTGSQLEEAFREGLVRHSSGRKVKKGDKLELSDLDFTVLQARITALRAGNPAVACRLIEKCPDFVVLDKGAGVASQPLSLLENDTVVHWVLAHYPEAAAEFLEPQPLLTPHRLDRGTSGLIVGALTKEAHERWREGFSNGLVDKAYLARCWGTPKKDEFEVSFPIGHAPGEGGKMVAIYNESVKHRPPVMAATSRVKVMEVKADQFLARVESNSGATHQVRVHLAALGYPLVGDSLYDPFFDLRDEKLEYHQLRATRLAFEGRVFQLEESF